MNTEKDNIEQMLQKLRPYFKYHNKDDLAGWGSMDIYLRIEVRDDKVQFPVYQTINENIEKYGYAYVMKRIIKKYEHMLKKLPKWEKQRQKKHNKKRNANKKVNKQFEQIMQKMMYCPYCGKTKCGCGL